ncbi:hypothetical protein B0H11DRAFT_1918221 [Mycena galericulata]|nr:hypothetical protein B0H11DRAFT_1918221 [Mycena galericulata]
MYIVHKVRFVCQIDGFVAIYKDSGWLPASKELSAQYESMGQLVLVALAFEKAFNSVLISGFWPYSKVDDGPDAQAVVAPVSVDPSTDDGPVAATAPASEDPSANDSPDVSAPVPDDLDPNDNSESNFDLTMPAGIKVRWGNGVQKEYLYPGDIQLESV